HVASFSRKDEPRGERTMEWGTTHAFRHAPHAPEVIYDTGGIGKEAMVRLVGCDALHVVERAVAIARIVGGNFE
ncbi:bifunctional hydroxymethylpyrimidine kinase/phosphomethylpyrimidine kinase, partial [Methanosarcinales archaeon ex4572_44]